MVNKCKEKIPGNKSSAKMPHLVAPIHAFDEKNTRILYENQKIILEHVTEFTRLALSIKRDIRKIIIEEVTKEIGDKINMIEAIYKRTIVIQNIWFDKGIITREEIAKKYEELKNKKEK